MSHYQLVAEEKKGSGKKAAKATRAAGLIPAIIYGGDKDVRIGVKFNDVKKLIFTNEFVVSDIKVGDEVHTCFVKDVQLHPVTDEILHIDFIRLREGVPVKIALPIRFEGTPKGVRDGGSFLQQVRKIRIKVLPKHIVPAMTVDISHLGLGEAIRVRDLNVEEGVKVLENPAMPIGQVIVPRALKSVMGQQKAQAGQDQVEEASAE